METSLARAPFAPASRVELEAGARLAVSPETAFVVVERGLVALFVGDERPVLVLVAAPREILLPPARQEQIRTLAPAAVRLVDDEERKLLLAERRSAAWLVDSLACALREREQALSRFAHLTHRDRVLAVLIELAQKFGRVTSDGVRVDLPLTHGLLASAIGSARETVTLALRDLAQNGIVVREGRRYRLKIPPDTLA